MTGRRRISTSSNSVVSRPEYHTAGVQSTKNGEKDWKKKLPSIIGHLPMVQSFFGVLSTVCWTANLLIFAFLPVVSAFSKANFFKKGHVYWNFPKQLALSFTKQKSLLFFFIFLCLFQNASPSLSAIAGAAKKGMSSMKGVASKHSLGGGEGGPVPAINVMKPEVVSEPAPIVKFVNVPYFLQKGAPEMPMELPNPTAIPDGNYKYFQPKIEFVVKPAPPPSLDIPPPETIVIHEAPRYVWQPEPPPAVVPKPPVEIVLPPTIPEVPLDPELVHQIAITTAATVASITGVLAVLFAIVFGLILLCKRKKPKKPKKVKKRKKRRGRKLSNSVSITYTA